MGLKTLRAIMLLNSPKPWAEEALALYVIPMVSPLAKPRDPSLFAASSVLTVVKSLKINGEV